MAQRDQLRYVTQRQAKRPKGAGVLLDSLLSEHIRLLLGLTDGEGKEIHEEFVSLSESIGQVEWMRAAIG